MITINAQFTQQLVAVVIPLIVGILVTKAAPSWMRAVTLIVLTAVATAISTATQADGVAVLGREDIILAIDNIVIAVAMYFGVWKPSGISTTINDATATFGIGPSAPPAE